eukprot:2286408-Pyramimonas_sp.AAC.1
MRSARVRQWIAFSVFPVASVNVPSEHKMLATCTRCRHACTTLSTQHAIPSYPTHHTQTRRTVPPFPALHWRWCLQTVRALHDAPCHPARHWTGLAWTSRCSRPCIYSAMGQPPEEDPCLGSYNVHAHRVAAQGTCTGAPA